MKSMCQEARRSSPSVIARRPTSSCIAIASRIASSSAARSSCAREAALVVRGARLEQRGRAQQAADVVGAERRDGSRGPAHDSP